MENKINHSTDIKDRPFYDAWLKTMTERVYEMLKENYNKRNKTNDRV